MKGKTKVEVLYVAGCPSHPAAVKLIRCALAAEGVAAEIDEVLVADERMARQLGFLGSPTIRIDGRDVVEERREPQLFGLSCRLYPGSGYAGLPPAETVRRAVTEARRRSEL
jgi:protein-disulfide isomerase